MNGRSARLVVTAGLCALAGVARARTPPVVADAREGVWIGAGEVFVHQARDRFSVYVAPSTVNKLAVDGLTVWIATDDGAVRFESGSRRMSRLTMDDGLPSQAVAAVAVDERFVWFATNKGLARWRKHDRTIRVFTDEDGLPHRAVNDALVVGRQVWFATRGGLAVYDPDVDGFRAYTREAGLDADDVAELYLVGEDLWCRTDTGLARVRPRTRAITNFAFADVGGEEIHAFALDGERIWVGTENGLAVFESQSDAFQPFPQQAALASRNVVGIEPFSDWIFIVTDEEVVQYHKIQRSFRRFTEADGLARRKGAVGTVLSGGVLTVLFADGAELYDIQRDLWSSRSLRASSGQDRRTTFRAFGRLNAELPFDLGAGALAEERFATAEGGFGLGHRFGDDRSLDVSLRLDYGQLELAGIRDFELVAAYLGNSRDVVREVRAESALPYRTLEEGIDPTLRLEGGQARLATPGERPAAAFTGAGGRRRGASVRDFLHGPRQEIYQLSQRWILPGSERVYVDGELLTAGTDYTVIYPAGQLAFLDPERVDDLSIIEVEYEFDLQPKKGLGTLSLLDLLPADREVGDWTRAGEARLITEESGLYAQIDGAAPKYIDRGWKRSVYVEYRQGSRTIQVAIHDMGSDDAALAIWEYDLPPAREPVADRDNLVVDVGLATSYAAKAYAGSFYLELTIDERSDAAKQSLKLFAIQVLDRGDNAGAHDADVDREWLASARAAASPWRSTEFGVRAVLVRGARELLLGVADARWEDALGARGRVTAYGELAGSSAGDDDGWGGVGRLRVTHPALDATLSGRHHGPGFTPIGSDAAFFGTLRDEARLAGTGYPARWLPVSAFFVRQLSVDEEERVPATGVVQHAYGRVQLARDDAPTTSLQVGHTLLDGAGERTSRLKGVAQVDTDLAANVLRFTGMKRFAVRALYGLSQAETRTDDAFAHGDRVQVARLEVKLAPTTTESAYALFRARELERQELEGGGFARQVAHWELNAGARSAAIPGVIPQLNTTVIWDDDRVSRPFELRAAKGSFAAAIGLYPGNWWPLLTPVVVEPRYSLSSDEQVEGGLRTRSHVTHRLDNRAIYAGEGRVDLELFQLWESERDGAGSDEVARRVELRNRAIYRPSFASPFTLRLNYLSEETRNDVALAPGAPAWGTQRVWEGALEWLRRWSRAWTTQLKGGYSFGFADGIALVDPVAGTAAIQDFDQHRVSAATEVRLFHTGARLYLIQRNAAAWLFGDGDGSTEAVVASAALGAIWLFGDNLYLDFEAALQRTHCLAEPCTSTTVVTPRLWLTANL